VHIIWLDSVQYDYLYYQYCATACLSPTAWSAAPTIVINTRTFNCRMAHLSIVAWGSGPTRQVVVAAEKIAASDGAIFSNSFRNEAWVHAPTALGAIKIEVAGEDPRTDHNTPLLALAPTNTVHMVWYQNGAGFTRSQNGIRYARFNPTTATWSDPSWIADYVDEAPIQAVDLTANWDSAFVNTFSLVVDTQDTVHVAWPEWTDSFYLPLEGKVYGTNQRLQWRSCPESCADETAWSPAVTVADALADRDPADTGTVNHDVRLAATADGQIYAVWHQLDDPAAPTKVRIVFAVHDSQRGWLGSMVVYD